MKQVIKKLNDFAKKYNVDFIMDGECGFGRPCTGFSANNQYIAYNPIHIHGTKLIYLTDRKGDSLKDDRHFELKPKDAYHKHDCMAVLVYNGDYDEGYRQLAEWVDNLEKIGVEIVDFDTLEVGLQAMVSGTLGKALKLSK